MMNRFNGLHFCLEIEPIDCEGIARKPDCETVETVVVISRGYDHRAEARCE